MKEGKKREYQRNIDRNIETFTIVSILLHPQSRGMISLKSADPFDPPIIDPNYLDHPDDIKTLMKGKYFRAGTFYCLFDACVYYF